MTNSLNNSSLSLRQSKEIYKGNITNILTKRVECLEKSLTRLSAEFAGYVRRTAKLRNNGDEISSILLSYADEQFSNDTTNYSVRSFAEHLTVIEDLRDLEVNRLRMHVNIPLENFVHKLKTAKNQIKKEEAAFNKQMHNQKSLDRNKAKPGSVEEAMARNQTHFATMERSAVLERLTPTVTHLEQEKLTTMQQLLKSYVHIEMLWHMRALEHYTHAYNSLGRLSVDSDVNQLGNWIGQDYLTPRTGNWMMTGGGTMMRSHSTNSLFTSQKQHQSDPHTNLRHDQQSSSHGDLRFNRTDGGLQSSLGTPHHRNSPHISPGQPGQSTVPARPPPVQVGASVKPPSGAGVVNGSNKDVGANRLPNNHFDDEDDEDDDDDDEYTDDDGTDPTTTNTARTTNRSNNGQKK